MTSESEFPRHRGHSPWLARRILLLMMLAGLLVPSISRAAPSDTDRATARALAQQGYEAQKRGDYAVAEQLFTRAGGLVAAPTLLIGLARARVGLGKLVEASETYQRILREGTPPGSPAPFERAVDDAKREAAALVPRIAWVTLDVRSSSVPTVVVDGAVVLPAALGVPRPYDAGTHGVRLTAEGCAPLDETFVAAEGETRIIALTPRRLSVADDTAPPHRVPVQTKLGTWALGIGIAGLVVGGVAGALVLADHVTLSRACPDGHCPPAEGPSLDTYHALATVSTASIIAGASLGALGTALLLSTSDSKSVTPYAGLLRLGIRGTF